MLHLILQADIIPQMIKQGPVFSLLAVAVLYFYNKQKSMDADMSAFRAKHEADMAAANDKLETYMNNDRELLLTALNNNTKVIQDITNWIEHGKSV